MVFFRIVFCAFFCATSFLSANPASFRAEILKSCPNYSVRILTGPLDDLDRNKFKFTKDKNVLIVPSSITKLPVNGVPPDITTKLPVDDVLSVEQERYLSALVGYFCGDSRSDSIWMYFCAQYKKQENHIVFLKSGEAGQDDILDRLYRKLQDADAPHKEMFKPVMHLVFDGSQSATEFCLALISESFVAGLEAEDFFLGGCSPLVVDFNGGGSSLGAGSGGGGSASGAGSEGEAAKRVRRGGHDDTSAVALGALPSQVSCGGGGSSGAASLAAEVFCMSLRAFYAQKFECLPNSSGNLKKFDVDGPCLIKVLNPLEEQVTARRPNVFCRFSAGDGHQHIGVIPATCFDKALEDPHSFVGAQENYLGLAKKYFLYSPDLTKNAQRKSLEGEDVVLIFLKNGTPLQNSALESLHARVSPICTKTGQIFIENSTEASAQKIIDNVYLVYQQRHPELGISSPETVLAGAGSALIPTGSLFDFAGPGFGGGASSSGAGSGGAGAARDRRASGSSVGVVASLDLYDVWINNLRKKAFLKALVVESNLPTSSFISLKKDVEKNDRSIVVFKASYFLKDDGALIRLMVEVGDSLASEFCENRCRFVIINDSGVALDPFEVAKLDLLIDKIKVAGGIAFFEEFFRIESSLLWRYLEALPWLTIV